MPRTCEATEEDWATVEKLFREGTSLANCSRAIDGRASAQTIGRRGERRGWVRDNGLPAKPTLEERRAKTEHANEALQLKWAEQREAMISKLIERADHLLDRIIQPHEIIDVKSVSGGKDSPGEIITTRIPIAQPIPGDQQRLMTSAAIAIDKIQLLAGEATSRAEHIEGTDREGAVARAAAMRDEVAARRKAREEAEGETAAAGS